MTPTHDRSRAHNELLRRILLELGQRTDLRIFDNPRGFDERSKSTYGLAPGASDLVAITKPRGRWLALEVKTGAGVPTKEQQAFLDMVNNFGGVGRVVRSLDDAQRAADEACK